MQSKGLVKTTPLPTRDTDIRAKIFCAQAGKCRGESPGHASGVGQCSCLSRRFSGRLVVI
jgi:hypothetical protein